MNKQKINDIIENIILKNKVSDIIQDNITVDTVEKCSPSTQKGVIKAFQEQSAKYGLKSITPDESGSAFTLYDEKHDTYMDFSNAFINKNIIDVKNNGDKYINLEEIFRTYDNLPSKVKNQIGLIKFHNFIEGKDVDDGTLAWARWVDQDSNTIGTITFPDYFFTKYNPQGEGGASNFEFVFNHEASHNYDYKKLTPKTRELVDKYFNKDYLEYTDMKKVYNYFNASGKQKYVKTYGVFDKAKTENENYLVNNGANFQRNRSSDYGATKPTEDFAEASAMVLTGLHNPDNPNATVRYNNREMQFREWVTVHPYQAQALAKEYYGENYTIDEILAMGTSTPLVPTS